LACLERLRDATFSQRLKACRVAAGLTLRQLAQKTGISLSMLQQYAFHCRLPSPANLAKLADALGSGVMPRFRNHFITWG
jgi:transcriptional regulator with XRE-family HTH domain